MVHLKKPEMQLLEVDVHGLPCMLMVKHIESTNRQFKIGRHKGKPTWHVANYLSPIRKRKN